MVYVCPFAFSNLAVRSEYKGNWRPFDLFRVLRESAYQPALRPSGFTTRRGSRRGINTRERSPRVDL